MCCNKIVINTDKTKFMLYSFRGDHVLLDNVKIGTGVISKVNVIKYLGVYLDKNLTFTKQINSISSSISRAVGMLYKLRLSYPVNVPNFLYYVFAQPHMLYGMELWFGAPAYLSGEIEVLQKRAVRCVNLLNAGAHTQSSFQQMKLLTIQNLYKFKVAIYMFKTINLDNFDRDLYNR